MASLAALLSGKYAQLDACKGFVVGHASLRANALATLGSVAYYLTTLGSVAYYLATLGSVAYYLGDEHHVGRIVAVVHGSELRGEG